MATTQRDETQRKGGAAAKEGGAKPGQRANAADRHVGARIRERRVMMGLSQQQLARMVGVTYQQAHNTLGQNEYTSQDERHLCMQDSLPEPEPLSLSPASQVCSGVTGHTEAVRVRFNPTVVSYQRVRGHQLFRAHLTSSRIESHRGTTCGG